jgi:RNA 2',3'-cyclic 3'-phosphodiesterase
MRVFVAFDLSIRTVENLVLLQEDLQKPLAQLGAKARWIDAANIHLTLKFIGEVERSLVFRIREVLAEVARRHPLFDTDTSGTGCFPSYRTPRIVWAGSGQGAEAVARLQNDIETHLGELGIPADDRTFHPHVTIGRVQTRKTRVDLEPVLTPYRDTVFGSSQVKDFALYESQLNPSGVVYRVIERYPLTG